MLTPVIPHPRFPLLNIHGLGFIGFQEAHHRKGCAAACGGGGAISAKEFVDRLYLQSKDPNLLATCAVYMVHTCFVKLRIQKSREILACSM